MAQTASPAERWLTEEQAPAWRALAVATRLLMDRLDRELQRDAGMPHAYYVILVALSEQPGHSLRMTGLANLLRYSKTRLSEAVSRLEVRGWVQREPCPTDRRSTFAVLTDEGFAALEAAAPSHVAAVRRHVFDQLTAEQVRQLRDIATAIVTPLIEAAGFDAGQCDQPGGLSSIETRARGGS